jgi:hypothetical protein
MKKKDIFIVLAISFGMLSCKPSYRELVDAKRADTSIKCSRIKDMEECVKTTDSSGRLCKENSITKKCVEHRWKNKIKKEECVFADSQECINGKVKYSEQKENGGIIEMGMCGFNANLSQCEPVRTGSGDVPPKMKCVANMNGEMSKMAAEDLCRNYQTSNGEEQYRKKLNAGSDCSSIEIHDGSFINNIAGICQTDPDDPELCTGYLSVKNPTGNHVDIYCSSLVKKELLGKPDLSGVYEVEVYEDCGKKALSTMAKDTNGQAQVLGKYEDVCILTESK